MTKNLNHLLKDALRRHLDVNLEKARLLYQEILTDDSENHTALSWIGVIKAPTKKLRYC